MGALINMLDSFLNSCLRILLKAPPAENAVYRGSLVIGQNALIPLYV